MLWLYALEAGIDLMLLVKGLTVGQQVRNVEIANEATHPRSAKLRNSGNLLLLPWQAFRIKTCIRGARNSSAFQNTT